MPNKFENVCNVLDVLHNLHDYRKAALRLWHFLLGNCSIGISFVNFLQTGPQVLLPMSQYDIHMIHRSAFECHFTTLRSLSLIQVIPENDL